MPKTLLLVETLEGRIVPTRMRWAPQNNNFDWNNNGNWEKPGVVADWVAANAIPGGIDDVEFQPGAGLNQRCEITNIDPDIRSLKLVNGFTAPIKVGRTITVDGAMTMDSGAIVGYPNADGGVTPGANSTSPMRQGAGDFSSSTRASA